MFKVICKSYWLEKREWKREEENSVKLGERQKERRAPNDVVLFCF